MSLDREQFSITNVLRCRPRNNWLEKSPWEHAALAHCRPNLDAAIAKYRPRCIVALGGIALRELTGEAGPQRGVSHLAGYVLPLAQGEQIPVIGDFHPAYLRRGKASHQGVFARILQRALNIAAGRDREWMWNVDPEVDYEKLSYQTHPSLDDAWSYFEGLKANQGDSGGSVVSYDIETAESASIDEDAREGFADTYISLVQFSCESRGSIALPWEGEYRRVAQQILLLPHTKCGHNVWLFDNKVLRAAGEREGLDLRPRGVIHDTLAMFHHWQPDLPAHLQFAASFVQFPFPWKHLAATDIEFYGCCDVDATLRLYNMLERTLRRDQLWGNDTVGYLGQVYYVRPILAAMEDRGLPVDNTARLRLGEEFDAARTELGAELARLAPPECRRVHPKSGYKGIPPEVRKCNLASVVTEMRFRELDDGEWYSYHLQEFPIADVDAATGEPVERLTTRWCRVYDFNPGSQPQLISYMRAKKHPVPKSKHTDDEGEQKDTTEKKELRRLAHKTGDTFYLKVIEYRELSKAKGTYVDGFVPGSDGRVHTTFTFDTAIGQLSSRNPNIQNFPKHGTSDHQRRLFEAMRRMIAAPPGHILVEWDYHSCHVITLGFLAEDLNYMRLGRLDIHSFVAGHVLGLWDGSRIFNESDDELRNRFSALKSVAPQRRIRDDQAKHAILGIGNGLKAKGLYERYMDEFASQKQAKRLLDVAEQLFPKVFAWQKRIQKLAHEQQYLRTEFGHIRRFYEVFRWDIRRNDWGHGDQAEEAIAFWLANIAHSHVREAMKELSRRGLDEKYCMCDQVHDALLFDIPESQLDEHVAEVYPVLHAPSKILRHPVIAPDGLVIDLEVKAGYNWADMHEIPLDTSPSHGSTILEAKGA